MKNWQKLGLFTLLFVLIAGVRVFMIWRDRNTPAAPKQQVAGRKLTDDDVVQPRKMYITDLADAKQLAGKTVWVQAGYELDYYPYAGHVDFAHKIGALPGAQAIAIKSIETAKVPASAVGHVPHGDKQVFAIFTLPKDAKQYATAIGSIQGGDANYYCDDFFYYDDPHTLYKHWPADVWQTIDKHEAKPGMSELETAMSLGVLQQSDSSAYGDRTVHYDAGGTKWTVSFVKNHATTAKKES